MASLAIVFVLVGTFAAWAADPPASAPPGSLDSRVAAELSRLKALLAAQQKQFEEQQQQMEQLRQALDLARQQMETISASVSATPSDAPPCATGAVDCAQNTAPHVPRLTEGPLPGRPRRPLMASADPALTPPPLSLPAALPSYSPPPTPPQTGEAPVAPHIRIGDAYFTPIGFVDFTTVIRSAATGSGIGTNFGAIPYNNVPTARLTDFLPNLQNSRIGVRIDTKVHGWRVIGYWESDFLGLAPGNLEVTSNSNTFRLRLFWVDVRKNHWEFLGGQSWSLLTPNRVDISPLPSNIFYTLVEDVNYVIGLTWGRTPQFRVVYHASEKFGAAISLEEPQQYIGGSGGQGSITFPTNSNIATNYANQLNNGNTTLSVPNVAPDVIGKLSFDTNTGKRKLHQHIELVGLYRQFRVWNPANNRYFRSAGGGGSLNMNFEVLPGLHLITNTFASDGGGRWLFGSGPDLIILGNGAISPIHAYSTLDGVEYTRHNTQLFTYYGAAYFTRNTAIDLNGVLVGYGYHGSPNTQNRTVQEGTGGIIQTFWKDPKYGALLFIVQPAYFFRNPWYVIPGQPRNAHNFSVFLSLRYNFPGLEPSLR